MNLGPNIRDMEHWAYGFLTKRPLASHPLDRDRRGHAIGARSRHLYTDSHNSAIAGYFPIIVFVIAVVVVAGVHAQ